MKGKKLIIYTIVAMLIILASFVIYFGFSIVEKTNIQNVAFTFTIITEIIFFGAIYLTTRKEENTFSKSGVISASFIYLIVSLILNIILKGVFSVVRTLITTNIIVIILYIVLVLVIYLFKKEQ